jgi:hypothetical protein
VADYRRRLVDFFAEVAMILRLIRGRMKISGCARDDAGRSVVRVSPF